MQKSEDLNKRLSYQFVDYFEIQVNGAESKCIYSCVLT